MSKLRLVEGALVTALAYSLPAVFHSYQTKHLSLITRKKLTSIQTDKQTSGIKKLSPRDFSWLNQEMSIDRNIGTGGCNLRVDATVGNMAFIIVIQNDI